jgi:hypothetical protein
LLRLPLKTAPIKRGLCTIATLLRRKLDYLRSYSIRAKLLALRAGSGPQAAR